MVVLVMEKVPSSLRGELTRWTLEIKAGVFVGALSAVVRDLLWDRVKWSLRSGGAIMIHSDNSEQGFAIRYWGETSRRIEDFEGLWLVGVEENQA